MKSNRRAFLKKSVISAAAVGMFPAILKAGVSPNEKVVVGLIGCGNKGFSTLKTFISQKNVVCGALCDADPKVLSGRAAQTEKIQHKKPAVYTDFRQLLENNEIDAVIIDAPDFQQSLPMVFACETGKAIYLETPMAGSVHECNKMVDAQIKYRNVVQVGQWQFSREHWKKAADYLKAGSIGSIQSVHAWHHQNETHQNKDLKSPACIENGEVLARFGLPLLGFARSVLNVNAPETITSTGGNFVHRNYNTQLPDAMMTTFDFGSSRIIWDHSFGLKNGHFNRKSGVAFSGEAGVLVLNDTGWEVLPNELARKNGFKGVPFQKATDDGLQQHVQNFLNSIAGSEKPNCDIETGAQAAKMCHFGNISFRLGKKLYWNENRQEFVNNTEAGKLLYASNQFKLPLV